MVRVEVETRSGIRVLVFKDPAEARRAGVRAMAAADIAEIPKELA
jgi:hypothetical protein